jgi:hypothetical protein
MTAAVYRSGTPSLSVPQSQNTAPVLEFNCLYTHDIRRKQKRWQDGFLRFHTFNKRVMVYDVPRNFIGDAHWKAGVSLQDGDEVILEKNGVLVQVAESVGRTETDLTELRQSIRKESSEKGSSSPMRPSRTPAPMPSGGGTVLKHRSLNALLGTPKGPIGKAALPTKSPFEERQASLGNQEVDEGRPAKRQRIEQPPAWNVVRTAKATDALSKKPPPAPLRARTSDSAKQRRKPYMEPGQKTLATKEIIDLCDDTEEMPDRFLPGFSSDALAPSSPPREAVTPQIHNSRQPTLRFSSPAFQTQHVPPRARTAGATASRDPSHKRSDSRAQATPIDNSVPANDCGLSEKAVSKTCPQVQPSVQFSDLRHAERQGTSEDDHSKEMQPPPAKPVKTLRIAASASKKKTLLCHDQLSTKSSRSQRTQHDNNAVSSHDRPSLSSRGPERAAKSQRERLHERLARIAAKGGNGADSNANNQPSVPQLRPRTPLEQNALELAELDRMIVPPARPSSPMANASPKESRQLRRVLSEADVPPGTKSKRVPGATVRYTPSPAKKPPSAASSVAPSDSEASLGRQISAPPSRARAKKPLQRAVSLNTASNGTSTVILSKPFQTPKAPMLKMPEPAKAPNPWSREAFDLLTWRPPGWDEENWCSKAVGET